MNSPRLIALSALALCTLAALPAWTDEPTVNNRHRAPRIWTDKDLKGWATPVAGINEVPHHYSEKEYYAAPADNLRSYPVYAPGREPQGYRDWLQQQEPQPLVEEGKARTDTEWVEAGKRVFAELDLPTVRTDDKRLIEYLADPEAVRKDGTTVLENGVIPDLRWVVVKKGQVRLSLQECAGCHRRVMPDNETLVDGAPNNTLLGPKGFEPFADVFNALLTKGGKPIAAGERTYMAFGVPWLASDMHADFRTMPEKDVLDIESYFVVGTTARFNGSPFYVTKNSDLIGVAERRYLDHTGTHANRGVADIARYAALVTGADDGSIGSHRFMTDEQRKLRFRYSDDVLYALAKYIYSLKPPANPNRPGALSERGRKVFDAAGCATCHPHGSYTTNRLIPVVGFDPPKDDPLRSGLKVSDQHIDTDPGAALKTRKGTGYYLAPTLKGLWYRGLYEHSGSVASLEEFFDRKRLRPDYVPGGWKGPGVKTRAVPGHEYGLDLDANDKKALIAFLKTL